MKIFVIFAFMLNFGVGIVNSNSIANCTSYHQSTTEVQYGWPTQISCIHVIQGYTTFMVTNGKYGQSDNTTCYVVNSENNETLWSTEVDMSNPFLHHVEKYTTPDLHQNSSKQYNVILRGNSTCFYETIKFTVLEKEEEDCQKAQMDTKLISFKARQFQMVQLMCDEDVTRHLKDAKLNYTIEWYRNCTKLDASGNGKNKFYDIRSQDDSLMIRSADFNTSGIYTCAVIYKGKKRFVIHRGLCVKPPVSYSDPSIVCQSSQKVDAGKEVKLTCEVDAGFTDKTSAFNTRVYWRQEGQNTTFGCMSRGTRISSGWNGRASCHMNVSAAETHNEKCYLYEPSDDEKQPRKKVHKITLSLRDFKESDFGKFNVTYSAFGKVANATMSITKNGANIEFYIYIIIGISAMIGIILIAFAIGYFAKRSR